MKIKNGSSQSLWYIQSSSVSLSYTYPSRVMGSPIIISPLNGQVKSTVSNTLHLSNSIVLYFRIKSISFYGENLLCFLQSSSSLLCSIMKQLLFWNCACNSLLLWVMFSSLHLGYFYSFLLSLRFLMTIEMTEATEKMHADEVKIIGSIFYRIYILYDVIYFNSEFWKIIIIWIITTFI